MQTFQQLISTSGLSEKAEFYTFMKTCINTLRTILTPTSENRLSDVAVFFLELQPTFNKETSILLHCTDFILSVLYPKVSVIVLPAIWKDQYIQNLPIDLKLRKTEYKNDHARNKAMAKAYMKHHLETEIASMSRASDTLTEEKLNRYKLFLEHYKKSEKKDDFCDAWTQVHAWQSRCEDAGIWKSLFEAYKTTESFKRSANIDIVSIDFGTSNLGWWRGFLDEQGRTDGQEWKVVDLRVRKRKDRGEEEEEEEETVVKRKKKKRKVTREKLKFHIESSPDLVILRQRLKQ